MDKENMKNMVVLRNLPSNIVDEAIVILKPNVKIKSVDLSENKNKSRKAKEENKENSKKYIINEAEMIISNYLSNIENNKKNAYKINKKIETKYKRLRATSIILGILFLASFLIK